MNKDPVQEVLDEAIMGVQLIEGEAWGECHQCGVQVPTRRPKPWKSWRQVHLCSACLAAGKTKSRQHRFDDLLAAVIGRLERAVDAASMTVVFPARDDIPEDLKDRVYNVYGTTTATSVRFDSVHILIDEVWLSLDGPLGSWLESLEKADKLEENAGQPIFCGMIRTSAGPRSVWELDNGDLIMRELIKPP